MASYIERDLQAERIGDVVLYDALHASDGVRITLASDHVDHESFSVHGLAEPHRVSQGDAVVFTGQSRGAALRVNWLGGTAEIHPTAPDLAFFQDAKVGLAMRTEETAQTAVDWLTWHAKHHGLNAALIVDRAEKPGFGKALGRKLKTLKDLKVMVLRPGQPTGKPGLGREADAYFAPDAPGRDRMTPPPEDPWLAPFGDSAIYEVLRRRFLADAAGVMNIDLSDLLAPFNGPDVFDAAMAAPSGLVGLAGRHVYPWSLPKGRKVRFSDHTCMMFDRPSVRRRWCVAPKKTASASSWRLLRVVGADPGKAAPRGFWRCMALRHPGQRVAALVPKSGLRENAELIEATGTLGTAKAARMPSVSLKTPHDEGTITLVTSMKNEGPFIIDWIAWHRAIGADRFLIYSNDCTDGTEEILRLLDRAGIITHRNNDGYRALGLTPQHSVLAAADEDEVTQAADWVAFVDCDEYINIKRGQGRFADLFAAVGDANMISMTWRLFGNADVHGFKDEPVFDQFTSCAPELCRKPHQAWGFKTLFRNQGIYKKLGVHRPKGLNPQLVDQIRWVNGSGKPMPKTLFRNGWRSTTATYGYDIVQLNHYAVRSAESFLVKRERGRANHVTRDQGLGYWFRMNNNKLEGGVNAAARALFQSERDRLMSNQAIRQAHEVAVARHIERIKLLRRDPFYAEFYQTLTGERMQRLSRLLGHFGAGVFQSGPTVVPDELVFGDWKEGDFFTVPLPKTDVHGF